MGCNSQAEDLVQEAWLRFDRASDKRFLDDPTGYLYRIVRNLALDTKRRMRRETQISENGAIEALVANTAAPFPAPEQIARYKEDFALLQEALAELPERTRIACEMHRFGGAKLREIAAFLDISVPLAHKLVADGIEHCKERIGEWP